jgi:hypothetical protein
MAAVGDLDGDGDPDVVTVSNSTLRLTDTEGELVWAEAIPGGALGGAPTVADFDGDGAADIGVAGAGFYCVFDRDGTILWSMPIADTSYETGSSVFDFEADGAAEVVFADELSLWIFDGATGVVKYEEPLHASGTLYEYPVIADVDGDGSAEIVLASNNYYKEGWSGITVIGEALSAWAPARPVWNQFAYSISNVDDDGGIPATPKKNWLVWNNFRSAGVTSGPANWQSDLAVGASVCESECDAGTVDVTIPVENTGPLWAQSVTVDLVREDGTTVEAATVSVDSGEIAIVGPLTITAAQWGAGALTVRVDGPESIDECDETDNQASLGLWPCP